MKLEYECQGGLYKYSVICRMFMNKLIVFLRISTIRIPVIVIRMAKYNLYRWIFLNDSQGNRLVNTLVPLMQRSSAAFFCKLFYSAVICSL